MIRLIVTYALVLTSLCFVPVSTVSAQPITGFEEESSVEYQLPYPGILADSPLYVVKRLRNAYLIWSAKDSYAKSVEYLEQSDKKLAMSRPLLAKGKLKMSVEMVDQSNDLLQESINEYQKIEGNEEEKRAHLEKLRTAAKKHKIEIETLMKNVPQGDVQTIETLREETITMSEQLAKLK
jgi:hypothetical protein